MEICCINFINQPLYRQIKFSTQFLILTVFFLYIYIYNSKYKSKEICQVIITEFEIFQRMLTNLIILFQ